MSITDAAAAAAAEAARRAAEAARRAQEAAKKAAEAAAQKTQALTAPKTTLNAAAAQVATRAAAAASHLRTGTVEVTAPLRRGERPTGNRSAFDAAVGSVARSVAKAAAAATGDENKNGWNDTVEKIFGAFLPEGPKYLHAGPGSEWTQQGQGYDAKRDQILTSHYDQQDDGKDIPGVLLSIQDRTSGSEATHVRLVGTDGTGGPLHGGGVATDGNNVYVVGDGKVFVYSRDAIDAAGPGASVSASKVLDVPASSFATIHDGRLYVGSYRNGEEGSLYSFALSPDGSLSDQTYEGITPHNAQGVAVHDGKFLFTQSHGEDDPSTLISRPMDSDTLTELGELSPLSQGLNVIDGKLYVTSEANADQFEVPNPPSTIDVFDLEEVGLK